MLVWQSRQKLLDILQSMERIKHKKDKTLVSCDPTY